MKHKISVATVTVAFHVPFSPGELLLADLDRAKDCTRTALVDAIKTLRAHGVHVAYVQDSYQSVPCDYCPKSA